MVKKELGNFAGSISDYSKVNEFDTVYFNAIYNRAFSYKMMGDFPSALIDANRAVELRPRDGSAWGMRGNIYLLFGDYDEAIINYDEALKWTNSPEEIMFNKGLAELFDHRLREGCATLKQAVDELGYEHGRDAYINFCGP